MQTVMRQGGVWRKVHHEAFCSLAIESLPSYLGNRVKRPVKSGFDSGLFSMTGTRDGLQIDLPIILGEQWKMIGRDDVELFLNT
jgi:hypothetical protein